MSRAPEREAGRRVLLVINSLARGGAETQLIGVATHLRDRGHDVVIATLIGGNDFRDTIRREGLVVWEPADPAASWSLGHLWSLGRRIARWRPEVTISFLLQATLFVRLLRPLVRPDRAIASMRNERLETRLRSWVYRGSCFLDDTIVVNSHSARANLQQLGTIPRDERVEVIYNGVDATALASRAQASPSRTRSDLGLEPNDVVFLGVGRLNAQKDWPSFVEATRLLARADVVCLVAGDGALADELGSLVARAGLTDRFRLLGLRSDVPDLMRAADCLVLSSVHEGTPNVVLEALALDVPVIATDVGACRELLDGIDGVGAQIVPARDPGALSRAMDRVAGRRRTPGANGTRAVDAYSWERIGSRWAALVEPASSSRGVPQQSPGEGRP